MLIASSTRRLACDTTRPELSDRAQSQRAQWRARIPSLPRCCHERSLLCKTKERAAFFSRASFSHGSTVFNIGDRRRPVCGPVAHAECVPWRAEERREASRALSHLYRKKTVGGVYVIRLSAGATRHKPFTRREDTHQFARMVVKSIMM